MDSNISRNTDPFLDGSRGTVDNQYVSGNSDRESWKGMTNRIYTDVTHLMDKEGQLIRAELNEKVGEVKTGLVSLVSAGVMMFVGLISLAATATILLNMVTSLWLSTVIVTAAFLIVGAIMLGTAKKKLEGDKLKPRKSIEAFGEIRHSLKEKVNEITKH
mgnify:CR=1 FL=1